MDSWHIGVLPLDLTATISMYELFFKMINRVQQFSYVQSVFLAMLVIYQQFKCEVFIFKIRYETTFAAFN